jgi:MFS family permease
MRLTGTTRGTEPPGDWRAWVIWGTAAVFYLYEFFVRVAPSVMQEPLMEVMHVNAAGFGLAMGAYYYVYSPLQLVAGSLLDRYGARWILLPSVLVVAVGCLLEAFGQTMPGMTVARGLQGLGSAFAFVGTMYLAAQWFPHSRLALIAGLTTALGMAGGILGNAGLQWLIEVEGWRATLHFSWAAGVVVFLVMLAAIPPSSTMGRGVSWFDRSINWVAGGDREGAAQSSDACDRADRRGAVFAAHGDWRFVG